MTQIPDENNQNQIVAEFLHQAHESSELAQQSFRLALVMTVASAVVSLIGAGLLLTGKGSEGAIAAASNLVLGTGSLQLVREASKQKQEVNEQLRKIYTTIIDRYE